MPARHKGPVTHGDGVRASKWSDHPASLVPWNPPSMRKRELVRRALSAAGVTAARWRLLPTRLYCFNYHRVGDPLSTDFNRNIFSCSAERFEEHVRCLRDRFDLLSLDRLRHVVERGFVGRRPPALITFDDGYVDTSTTAFPILRRYDAPATFFLPTACVGSTAVPWWEEVHWLLRQATGQTVRLSGAAEPFPIEAGDGERSIRRVADFIKRRPIPMDQQVEEVRAACGGAYPPAGEQSRLFLDWAEVREMRAGGMDFGGHTHNHLVLAHLNPAGQREELARSKETLEAALGETVTAVAYPVGSASAYTRETCDIARGLGYRLGFNFRRHTNRLPVADALDIGRLAVSDNIGRGPLRSMACFPGLFAE
jgi:peptidoglycan/xylan/chitin deacetylase (PgdA/CDA1 family)